MKRILLLLLLLVEYHMVASDLINTGMNLEEAIALAWQQNRSILSDNLDRQDTRRQLQLQARQFFPTLELGYSRNDSVTVGSPDSRINKISLGLKQLLFSGGKELANYRMARREQDFKDLSASDLMNSIAYQVTLQFVEVLKYRQILSIQERSYENLQQQLVIAQREYELGALRSVDYLDLQLTAAEYTLTIQNNKEQLLQSRFNLASLLFFPLEKLPPLQGNLNENYMGYLLSKASAPDFIPLMQKKAEELNPNLLQLGLQEMNARRQLMDSRLAWIPRIEASADFSMSGQEYPLTEPAFSLGLNFQFDLPLIPSSVDLQAGQTNPDEYNRAVSTTTDLLNNLEGFHDPLIARTRLYKKQMEREETRLSILFQVRSLTENLLMTGQRIGIYKDKLSILMEKLRIQKVELDLGQITRLDYVESEIELADQKITFLESLVNLNSLEKELENLCAYTPDSVNKEPLINE